MPNRASPLLLYGILVAAILFGSGVAGYVYKHEPARDQLIINIQATPAPVPETLTGAIVSIDGDTLVLSTPDGGQLTLTLPTDVPIEDLTRSTAPLTAGSQVNVGVNNTTFGQVLTGIVAIQDATGATP